MSPTGTVRVDHEPADFRGVLTAAKPKYERGSSPGRQPTGDERQGRIAGIGIREQRLPDCLPVG
jgi:hypothetical protein